MSEHRRSVRDTAILATGSIAAQVISLVLTPVVTRLYSPEEFGYFATIFALAIPLVAISSLRYFDAIVLPRSDEEAFCLVRLSLILNLMISFIILLLIYYLEQPIAKYFKLQKYTDVVYMVPVFVLIIGGRRVVDSWLQRKKAYLNLSISTLSTSLIDRLCTIGLGLSGMVSLGGLITGRLAGVVSGMLIMIKGVVDHGVKRSGSENISSLPQVAKKYSSFAKYSWSGWVMQLTLELPVLAIGAYFSPQIVGLYALSRRVLMEPGILLGDALSKTFYVRASELHKDGRSLSTICESLLSFLMRISLPVSIVFVVVSEDLFSLIFGSEWKTAGNYASCLIPMTLAGFYMRPLARLFNILDKQKEMAAFSLIRLLGITLALIIGVIMNDAISLFISMSVMTVLIFLNRANWLFRQVNVSRKKIIRDFIINVVSGLIMATMLYTFNMALSLEVMSRCIAFFVVCLIYYIYTYREYRKFLKPS